MKTITYQLQPETIAAIEKVPANVVDGQSMRIGRDRGEPLLVCMDGLLRYAKAYECRFDRKLSEDSFLAGPWKDAALGLRALLNGDGAVAYELDRTTDSKSNGVLEELFWTAFKAAGMNEGDL